MVAISELSTGEAERMFADLTGYVGIMPGDIQCTITNLRDGEWREIFDWDFAFAS